MPWWQSRNFIPIPGSQIILSSPKKGNHLNLQQQKQQRSSFPFLAKRKEKSTKTKQKRKEKKGDATKMMHMTLYWSRYVTLLVDQWRTDTWTGYLLTLLACFLSASFYQYIEDRRLRLRLRSLTASSPLPITSDPASAPLIVKLGRNRVARAASSAMFGISSAVGYLLMLAIMSFNGGVFLAIVTGLTVGYYIFRSSVNEEEGGKISGVDNPCACA